MARTVHHVPWTQMVRYQHGTHVGSPCDDRVGGWQPDCSYDGPLHAVTDRRYTAAEDRAAAREGRRAVPAVRTVAFERASYVHLHHSLGEYANARERSARTVTRDRLRSVLGHANAVLTSGGDWDDLDEDLVEVTPTRHRGSARWDAI